VLCSTLGLPAHKFGWRGQRRKETQRKDVRNLLYSRGLLMLLELLIVTQFNNRKLKSKLLKIYVLAVKYSH